MITRRGLGSVAAVLMSSRGRAQASETVTVLSPGRRLISKVSDLARDLTTSNLNVVAAPGGGPIQNVTRLLERRDAQVAVLQADVLDYLQRRQLQPGAAESIRYIAQLYSAPI